MNDVSPEGRRNRAADARGSKTIGEKRKGISGRIKRRTRERRSMRNVMGGGKRDEREEEEN